MQTTLLPLCQNASAGGEGLNDVSEDQRFMNDRTDNSTMYEQVMSDYDRIIRHDTIPLTATLNPFPHTSNLQQITCSTLQHQYETLYHFENAHICYKGCLLEMCHNLSACGKGKYTCSIMENKEIYN